MKFNNKCVKPYYVYVYVDITNSEIFTVAKIRPVSRQNVSRCYLIHGNVLECI